MVGLFGRVAIITVRLQMVMENKVRIVVMLTKLREENEQGVNDLSNFDQI